MSGQAKCRSCGAAVVWLKTAAGKIMPVDAEPVEDGNMIVFEASREVRSVTEEDKPKFVGRLHKSHFATCVNAAKHRKK